MVGKFAMEYVKTTLPVSAMPAAMPVIVCSATPALTKRSGNC